MTSVLVAYASKHGATEGIAQRIGEQLQAAGLRVDVRPVRAAITVADYDAFVIGSAAYMFHWQKDAVAFVRRNREVLAGRPVWLFSSGPLGTEATDAQGRDVRETAVPREIPEFEAAIAPREHHVFFGALDRSSLGLAESLVFAMPAARKAIPEGDFRDWREIEAWAQGIATALTATSVASA
jgi:menaquinone-dependent protoporphyrinogen oxidase